MTPTTLSPSTSSAPDNMAPLAKATAAACAVLRRQSSEGATGETFGVREARQQQEWEEVSAAVDLAKPVAIIRSNRAPWTTSGVAEGGGIFVEANYTADMEGTPEAPFLRISNEGIDWTDSGAFLTRRQLRELLQWAERVGFFEPELGREGEALEECQTAETNAAAVLAVTETVGAGDPAPVPPVQ